MFRSGSFSREREIFRDPGRSSPVNIPSRQLMFTKVFTLEMCITLSCSMTENGSSSVARDVEDALSSMLSRGLSLDKQLLAASKKILLQKIEFRPAQRSSSLFPLHKLRAKYTPLNASGADEKHKAGLVTFFIVF